MTTNTIQEIAIRYSIAEIEDAIEALKMAKDDMTLAAKEERADIQRSFELLSLEYVQEAKKAVASVEKMLKS